MCIRDSDTGVQDEGLVAICGTPLVAEGEFVGVLFAAHRTRHTFTQEEVALLGSLADLAAVSICLLYTSDAADERSSVDLGGRRIIKTK